MPPVSIVCDLSLAGEAEISFTTDLAQGKVSRFHYANAIELDRGLDQFLKRNNRPNIEGAAFATRGYEEQGTIFAPETFVVIKRAALSTALSCERIFLVNDFVARAMTVPTLLDKERKSLCGKPSMLGRSVTVLGPDVGLGATTLAPDGKGGWIALPGEGGHSGLPVQSDREWQIFQALRQQFGRVSRETALSEKGLSAVHNAIRTMTGLEKSHADVSQIAHLAMTGDPRAREALDVFTLWLADMAADMVLMTGGRGGLYLTGNVIEKLGPAFDGNKFCQHFSDRGDHSAFLSSVPVYICNVRHMALRGLTTVLENR